MFLQGKITTQKQNWRQKNVITSNTLETTKKTSK